MFDHIHLAAALSQLAKLGQTRQLITAEGSLVWARMAARLRSMLREDELSPGSAASVLRAHGKLHETVKALKHAAPEIPTALSATAARIADKVEEMTHQELSMSLWAAARLQDTVPEVSTAVPAIAASIPHNADDMNSQDLSNSLWAVAKLQDRVPTVLVAMQALVTHIPSKISVMTAEGIL